MPALGLAKQRHDLAICETALPQQFLLSHLAGKILHLNPVILWGDYRQYDIRLLQHQIRSA